MWAHEVCEVYEVCGVCVCEGGSGSSTMGFGFGSYWGALWAHSIDYCLTRGSIVEVDGAGGRYRKRASARPSMYLQQVASCLVKYFRQFYIMNM